MIYIQKSLTMRQQQFSLGTVRLSGEMMVIVVMNTNIPMFDVDNETRLGHVLR